MTRAIPAYLLVASALLTACPPPAKKIATVTPTPEPTPVASPVALTHATIWTATGKRIEDGTVVVAKGRITAVGGPDTAVPEGILSIDVKGRIVTPGIIDLHSHAGVYASPGVSATADGNEMTNPVTPHVSAEHGIWPQDPNFYRILAAGTTSLLILPGSGNLIGGRGVAVHTRPARTVAEMKIGFAPPSLKMACGENPKRVYGEGKKAFPMTRMGNYAGYRAAFQSAKEYKVKWDEFRKKGTGTEPVRSHEMDTLAAVIDGEILVQNHCYKAEEMAQMMELAKEFGFKIRTFHHALEAYKVRDLLAESDVAVATWADWWGFKLEAYDGIPQNAALVHEAGARAIIHSDDATGAQMLNHESAKAMNYGKRAGIAVGEEDALRWITANPAWALGVEKDLGTIEEGKVADVVVWSGNPFSIYSKADQVFVEGRLTFDRGDPALQPRSDFELGVTR